MGGSSADGGVLLWEQSLSDREMLDLGRIRTLARRVDETAELLDAHQKNLRLGVNPAGDAARAIAMRHSGSIHHLRRIRAVTDPDTCYGRVGALGVPCASGAARRRQISIETQKPGSPHGVSACVGTRGPSQADDREKPGVLRLNAQ
jgi:hypothetical protein